MSDWSSKEGFTDNEIKADKSGSDFIVQENSSTDYCQSTDQDRFTYSDKSPDRQEKSPRGPKRTPTSLSLQENWRVREDGSSRPLSRVLLRHKGSLEEKYSDGYRSRSCSREDSRTQIREGHEKHLDHEKITAARSSSLESNSRHKKHATLREQKSNERMPKIEISRNQIEDVPSTLSSKEYLSKRNRPSGFQNDNPNTLLLEMDHSSRESRFSCESRLSRDSVSSRDSRAMRDSRISRDSCTSYESIDMSPINIPTHAGMRRKPERQNEVCYSSSSSLFSDGKAYQPQEYNRLELSEAPPSKFDSFQDDTEKRNIAQKLPRNMKKGLTANRLSSNSLSPDMALYRTHREKNYRLFTFLTYIKVF